MIAPRGTDERFIVPRWRSFARTARLGELSIGRVKALSFAPTDRNLEAEIQKFHEQPGLHFASDLIDRALHGETSIPAVRPVADYALEHPDAWPALRDSALAALQGGPEAPSAPDRVDDPAARASAAIRRLRARLRLVPRDPVTWTDLALAQTLTGNLERAQRSMRTAINLAPHNRFIVRSASRFFVHIDRPDIALGLAVEGRSRRDDPWLMAAEIAVATSIDSAPRSTLRSVQQVLNDGNHSQRDASELLCALATLEFDAGNVKRGRRLIDRALIDPTENAVAQAEYESQRSNFEIPQGALYGSGSDEARALESGSHGDWDSALAASRSWQSDQSFDADPATYRSYIAAVGTEDYEDALEATRLGLISNPGNPTLSNNRAFALAHLGRPSEAREVLARASHQVDSADYIARTATLGLIEYREGSMAEGRDRYMRAIQRAVEVGAQAQAGLAAAFYALEESRISGRHGALAIESVTKIVDASGDPDAAMLLQRARERASLPSVNIWDRDL